MGVKRFILSLDIGGTFIKSGVVTEDGLAAEIPPVGIDSDGTAAGILESFAVAIRTGCSAMSARVPGKTVPDAIGICIPDPFDYGRGISLMEHKFASIHGIDLAAAVRQAVPEIAGVPVTFCHDACAFLAGEMWQGNARGYDRVIGITLGTGFGAAIALEGKLQLDAMGGPGLSLWNSPLRGGIVEDYISSRALLQKYKGFCPGYDPAGGIKGIADAARSGTEPQAVRLFEELGADLGEVLLPQHERYGLEAIIFGGQISKSFSLFEPALKGFFRRSAAPPALKVTKLDNSAALYGAAAGGN